MAKIKIWPHHELCPDGAVINSLPDETICEAALREGIRIEHACEMSCACTTCHCIVRKGFDKLDEFIEGIEVLRIKQTWSRHDIIRLYNNLLPNFTHKETGKFLDQRM